MKLSDQIEALRQKMTSDHEDLLSRVEELNSCIFEQDAELMRMLDEIVSGQSRRAVDIAQMLATIHSRIGHIPPEHYQPLYDRRDPRAGIGQSPPPVPEDYEMAQRFAPHPAIRNVVDDSFGGLN